MMSARPTAMPQMFQPGLFETGDSGPCLLGSRCRQCRRIFFPRVEVCLDCLADDPEPCRLSRHGILECFTTVSMPALHIEPPYAVGYVALADGPRVFAPLEPAGGVFEVGMSMRLADYALGRAAERRLAYCFVRA
jgi:uncharacterized OB-fold protein